MSLDIAITDWIRSNPNDLFYKSTDTILSDLTDFQSRVKAGSEYPFVDSSPPAIRVYLIDAIPDIEDALGDVAINDWRGSIIITVNVETETPGAGALRARWVSILSNIASFRGHIDAYLTDNDLNDLRATDNDLPLDITEGNLAARAVITCTFLTSYNPF